MTTTTLFLPAACLYERVRNNRTGGEMNQSALFHESLNDAFKEVVMALGGTKTVGALMRPEKSADDAGRWLSDCLNSDRREHLTPEQVLFLLHEARKIGAHGAMYYLSSEAGYRAEPVEPEDERANLQREYIEAAKSMKTIAERMERLTLRTAA